MSKHVDHWVKAPKQEVGIGHHGVPNAYSSQQVVIFPGGLCVRRDLISNFVHWTLALKNRHATADYVGRYTQINLHARLLKPVCNAWSYHIHRERCNTCALVWDFFNRLGCGGPAGVHHAAPFGLLAGAHPSPFQDDWGSWLELAGEQPLWQGALRASCRSSKMDCQLWYIPATVTCCQQNWGDVSCQIWRSREPVYPPVWTLP